MWQRDELKDTMNGGASKKVGREEMGSAPVTEQVRNKRAKPDQPQRAAGQFRIFHVVTNVGSLFTLSCLVASLIAVMIQFLLSNLSE